MTPQEPPLPEQAKPENRREKTGHPWAFPVMWMVIVLIVVGGGVYVFNSCRNLPLEAIDKTGKLVDKLGHELQNVAAAFKQGTVSTTFTSYATTISGSQYLQFATLSQTEVFTRKDESTVAFGYLPLPDVIIQATAPVTYTYYLDLNERWDFELKDGLVWVVAPDIHYNKPAVDASRITYEVTKNSMFRNTTEALENLKNSITWMSYKKARANIPLVRETGRKQTETFVQNWLTRNFTDGKSYPVKVLFRSEAQTNAPAGLQIPTPAER